MHTGKNNPNYTHDMTGFSSVVIKQKPSHLVCANTFRGASSALQQSKRQEEHFKKLNRSYCYSTTKIYYAILVSPAKKGEYTQKRQIEWGQR